jgi:hypothetical protein
MKGWIVYHKIKSLYDNGNGLNERQTTYITPVRFTYDGITLPHTHHPSGG